MRNSALAFVAAIALECFAAWDKSTFIATAVVWVVSVVLTAICAVTLWDGTALPRLRDWICVLSSKFPWVTDPASTASSAEWSNRHPETERSTIEVVVGSKA